MKQLTWEEPNHYKEDRYQKTAFVDKDSIAGIESCYNTRYSKIVFKNGGEITVGLTPEEVIQQLSEK
jgi:hypothetical protein